MSTYHLVARRRNFNLPLSQGHGLSVSQMREFMEWVDTSSWPSNLDTRWAVIESIDNCFDVPTEDALDCAVATMASIVEDLGDSLRSRGELT